MRRKIECKYDIGAHGLERLRQTIRRNAVNHGMWTAIYTGPGMIFASAIRIHVEAPLTLEGAPLAAVVDESFPMAALRELLP